METFFCDVRLLSRGSMVARIDDLRNEIDLILKSKNINITVFQDPRLAF